MIASLLSAFLLAASGPDAGACPAQADRAFICGVRDAEDLVRVPGTDWVAASGMSYPAGRLHLIHVRTQAVRVAMPDPSVRFAQDRVAYGDCPGPPTALVPHGLAATRLDRRTVRLYVVNHGGREAVEVIDGDFSGRVPTLTWRGCIPAPADMTLNSVAALPGGAIAASLNAASVGAAVRAAAKAGPYDIEAVLAAQPPGDVGLWRPGGGWRLMGDTGILGPNGVVASPDGAFLFVAGWRGRSLSRIPLGQGLEGIQTIPTGFLTDNLRWGDDGRVYAAGSYRHCATGPGCDEDFGVLSIDPASFSDTRAARHAHSPGRFGGATTALPVGDALWLGTVRGDRIAIVPPLR